MNTDCIRQQDDTDACRHLSGKMIQRKWHERKLTRIQVFRHTKRHNWFALSLSHHQLWTFRYDDSAQIIGQQLLNSVYSQTKKKNLNEFASQCTRTNVMAWEWMKRHKSEISVKQIMSREYSIECRMIITMWLCRLQCGFLLFHQNFIRYYGWQCRQIYRCAALNHIHTHIHTIKTKTKRDKQSEADQWSDKVGIFIFCFFFCWSLKGNLMEIDKDH